MRELSEESMIKFLKQKANEKRGQSLTYYKCCPHPWFHQWCHQAASAAGSPGDWKAWSQSPSTGALRGGERHTELHTFLIIVM